jgi:gentisate 1,2-dioxygenase
MEGPSTGLISDTASAGSVSPERAAYYDRIGKQNLAPLWEVLKGLVPPRPQTPCVPALWRFADVKNTVLEAGGIITAKEAERRVLIFENPALRGRSRITQSLYAGLQLILPGEIAGAHRHTASAIRLVLDGEGAYTAVEGEKTVMRRGDLIITANWAVHDHGNPSQQPMIWLDVLDLPTVNFFDAAFAEHMDAESQSNTREDGDSYARYGSGVLPDGAAKDMIRTPIINYPYTRIKPVIERMAKSDDVDPHHGARVRYANPVDGGWVTPTMGAQIALLPKGFKGKDYRSTDGTIFVCVEGEGSTKVEDQIFHWTPGDVFVVPSWNRHAHTAKSESVLFSISDRPAQEKLGIWREQRAA